jgi:hypothetical protein
MKKENSRPHNNGNRVLPLYRQAGSPFGESDSGLLLWLEFGRRSYSN